jgi:hypothetical protein
VAARGTIALPAKTPLALSESPRAVRGSALQEARQPADSGAPQCARCGNPLRPAVRRRPDETCVERALLAARTFAAGALAAGALTFAVPDIAVDVWPWQLTPLTARVIASLTVQVGVGALGTAGALILLQRRMETSGALRNRVGPIDPRRSEMALVRVVSFDRVTSDRMQDMRSQMEGSQPPEGVPAKEIIVLHDADAEKSLVLLFFDSEEDYQRGDEALNAMSTGETPGQRSGVAKYDVAMRMAA